MIDLNKTKSNIIVLELAIAVPLWHTLHGTSSHKMLYVIIWWHNWQYPWNKNGYCQQRFAPTFETFTTLKYDKINNIKDINNLWQMLYSNQFMICQRFVKIIWLIKETSKLKSTITVVECDGKEGVGQNSKEDHERQYPSLWKTLCHL